MDGLVALPGHASGAYPAAAHPSTSMSNDLYTRTIVGLTYYFENFPPKVQSKIQFNYEFRHHQGNGPGVPYDTTFDAFAQNAFLVQFQIRFM